MSNEDRVLTGVGALVFALALSGAVWYGMYLFVKWLMS